MRVKTTLCLPIRVSQCEIWLSKDFRKHLNNAGDMHAPMAALIKKPVGLGEQAIEMAVL